MLCGTQIKAHMRIIEARWWRVLQANDLDE
jgi:hypothetical protein